MYVTVTSAVSPAPQGEVSFLLTMINSLRAFDSQSCPPFPLSILCCPNGLLCDILPSGGKTSKDRKNGAVDQLYHVDTQNYVYFGRVLSIAASVCKSSMGESRILKLSIIIVQVSKNGE